MTERPFRNLVAAAATLAIYTPVHITVTCAQKGAALDLAETPDLAEARARLETGDLFLLPLRAGGGGAPRGRPDREGNGTGGPSLYIGCFWAVLPRRALWPASWAGDWGESPRGGGAHRR